MSRSGEPLGGRFELVGEPDRVAENQRYLWKMLWAGRVTLPVAEDELWVRAVDRATGATVRALPRGDPMYWTDDVRREAVGRIVQALGLPGVVPVLHAGPGLVYAAPPAGARPRLTVAEAAEVVLLACEAAAVLHARGVVDELRFGPGNLRVVATADGWQIAWLVPGVSTLAAIDAHTPGRGYEDEEAVNGRLARMFGVAEPARRGWDAGVAGTLADLAGLFFELCPEADGGDERAELRVLAHVKLMRAADVGVADVAGLAGVLARLTSAPAAWAGRAAGLPAVPVPPRMHMDWDAVVADGEAMLRDPPASQHSRRFRSYVEVPLAGAYHQRASEAYAEGRAEEALADATRATELGGETAYLVTRAVILDALGRAEEARAAIDEAFARASPQGEEDETFERQQNPEEAARMLATRGSIALRERAFAQAEDDLRRAWALAHDPAHGHALGAVLYARGQVHAAATVELEVVARAPEDARYRWSLVASLVRLRRTEEARAHADEALRLAPDEAGAQRYARLLGQGVSRTGSS